MTALTIVLIASALCILLAVFWSMEIGILRGTLAALCRLGWISIFFMALFPKTVSQYVAQSVMVQPVNVLLDDSASMGRTNNPQSPISKAEAIIKDIGSACRDLGCELKVERLSALNSVVAENYSPLKETFQSWYRQVEGRPWLLLSDGGDWQPQRESEGYQVKGSSEELAKVIDLYADSHPNVWIERVNIPSFSFVDKPVDIQFSLGRSQVSSVLEHLQVQFFSDNQLIAAKDVNFNGQLDAAGNIQIAALAKGNHAIKVRIVPFATEKTLWDNQLVGTVEVLPNTVGVLHLLGTPNWDGRFLRRYLKSEPKYDLISFFILRDPWDSQSVDERELSLIPFPTDRLFQEELPNFKALVLQNFTLFQFLQSRYQTNLVKFVQNGGGALFVGGPRAFQMSDLQGSPLKEILPFATDKSSNQSKPSNVLSMFESTSHDTYDPDQTFKVRLAKPSQAQRVLANVYEDWKFLENALEAMPPLKGMNRTDRFVFDPELSTPLLEAEFPNGKRVPLAVASYPGKGRAIWIFTDQLWRLALEEHPQSARQIYNQFMQAAMSWLLRDEIKRPLILSGFRLRQMRQQANENTHWDLRMEGPAARYLDKGDNWSIQICDQVVPPSDIIQERVSLNQWRLSGRLPTQLSAGRQCWAKIEAQHSSFGSIQARATTVVPPILTDNEIFGSSLVLRQIAHEGGAAYVPYKEYSESYLREWLRKILDQKAIDVQSKLDTSQDFYWMFKTWWIYALFLMMPLEILIRKWKEIFS